MKNWIKKLINKYSRPENRFITIKNYRIKSQVFTIMCATVILSLTQNCTNEMRTLSSNVLSSSLPVIVVLTPVPPISNASSHTVIFDVVINGSSSFKSATCRLDMAPEFDCSQKTVNLTGLTDGDHTLVINAKDSYGSRAQAVNVVFRTDRTNPTVSFMQTPPSTTGATTASISFSAMDALSGVEKTECSLDGATFATCSSPVSLSNLSVGSHNFRVRAIDRAMNVSNIITANWVIESGAPVLNITSKPSEISSSKSANFAFSGSVGGTPMTVFECRLDGGAYAACNSGTQNYTNVTEGSHTFYVRGRTASGTMSDPVSVSWIVDSLAPTPPSITTSVGNPTQLKTASFIFSSTDATSGVAKYECSVDAGSYVTCTSPHNLTNVTDGNRTFRVRAVDKAGNVSPISTFTWTVDTVAPVLTFTQRPQDSANTTATFAFTATDSGVGIQSLRCSLDDANFTNCTSPHTVTVSNGAHTFRVQATDQVGNTATISHAWTVGTVQTPEPGEGDHPYPIMFVTSVPGENFGHLLSNFGNHSPNRDGHIPGGDLYIRYPDGTLRNLTQEAGYGVPSGQVQGDKGIVVREPMVHWSGEKALFSMAIGGTPSRYNQTPNRRYQIYEVTGLQKGQTVKITKVPGQPSNYNNLSPIYGANDDIFFTSDAPLFGMTHTYPQLDEYESNPTVTGIWKLDRATQKVTQIQHSPSGSFHLFLDSFGRIIFTRWDHLKRDQQADADRSGGSVYGSFDYKDESPNATKFKSPETDSQGRYIADSRGTLYDQFPEARSTVDRSRRSYETLHDFNKFTPWMIHEDGSEEETVNHMGRDEIFRDYREPVFNNDSNLTSTLTNFAKNKIVFSNDGGFFHFKEDINRPGYYLGTFSLEFGRQTSGRIVEFKMDPNTNPEDMEIKDYSGPNIDSNPNGSTRGSGQTGHYRNPLALSDGTILVSHTDEFRLNQETVSNGVHSVRYIFQLKRLVKKSTDQYYTAGPSLTGGIVKEIRWWKDESYQHVYNGPLNETDPVEVRPRPRPINSPKMKIADVERTVMQEAAVDENQFREWLKKNNLAVIVSRNVTIRDRADVTQPFNLRIPGGVSNIPKTGKVYDISHLQVFQADLTRSYDLLNGRGRRVYAKPIHNAPSHQNIETFWGGRKDGMTALGSDGSMAAIVPAGRALTWQLTSPDGTPVVRERYWITFAPGEVRTCASCHGLNKLSHNNLPEPTNKPEAFRQLLNTWKTQWWHIEP